VKRKLVFNIQPLKLRRKSLRETSTQAEKMLWERLNSVEGYVVDFYCPVKRLAIEIEGSIHNLPNSRKYDAYRRRYLEAYGIHLLRFTNQEIFSEIQRVVNSIKSKLCTPS